MSQKSSIVSNLSIHYKSWESFP